MRLFDLHCDTAGALYKNSKNLKSNRLHVDLERGSAFEEWCQVFAFFVPDGLCREDRTELFLDTYAYFEKQLEENSDRVTLCKHSGDMAYALENGRAAAIYSVENGAALGGDLNALYFCAGIGVKLISLTWNGENELAHGCASAGGLKPLGVEAVRIIDALGITVDVSHLNEEGFWQVLELVSRPPVATHSNSRAVQENARNLTDAQLAAIAEAGGIAGINLYPPFLSGSPSAGFDDILRHVYHSLEVGGENVLAFGADFDGAAMDAKWDGIQRLPDIYDYLSAHGLSDGVLDKIFFKNAYDFFCNIC